MAACRARSKARAGKDGQDVREARLCRRRRSPTRSSPQSRRTRRCARSAATRACSPRSTRFAPNSVSQARQHARASFPVICADNDGVHGVLAQRAGVLPRARRRDEQAVVRREQAALSGRVGHADDRSCSTRSRPGSRRATRRRSSSPRSCGIYRDVRFAKDKAPYKTHIAGRIGLVKSRRGVGDVRPSRDGRRVHRRRYVLLRRRRSWRSGASSSPPTRPASRSPR